MGRPPPKMKQRWSCTIWRAKISLSRIWQLPSRELQTGRVISLKTTYALFSQAKAFGFHTAQNRGMAIASYRVKRALLTFAKLGAACLFGGSIGIFLASLNRRSLKVADTKERDPKNSLFLMTLQTISVVAIALGSAVLIFQLPIRSIPGGRAVTTGLQRLVFRWSYGGASGLTSTILQSWPLRGFWFRLQVGIFSLLAFLAA